MPERRERGRARGMQYFSPANPRAPLTFLLSLSQRNKWTHLFQFNLITRRFIASRMSWQPFSTLTFCLRNWPRPSPSSRSLLGVTAQSASFKALLKTAHSLVPWLTRSLERVDYEWLIDWLTTIPIVSHCTEIDLNECSACTQTFECRNYNWQSNRRCAEWQLPDIAHTPCCTAIKWIIQPVNQLNYFHPQPRVIQAINRHILYIVYTIICVETHYTNASFMCPLVIAQASGKTHYKSQLIKNNKTFMFCCLIKNVEVALSGVFDLGAERNLPTRKRHKWSTLLWVFHAQRVS